MTFDESARDELLALVQKLIAIQSFTGQEGDLAHFLAGYLEAQGYDEVQIDEAGNVLAVIHGKHWGPSILFDGHIDTVEVGDEEAWRFPPFAGEVFEGRVYGRGTSDMKGALGAMIYAGNHIDREALHGSIYISATVNEEVAEGATLGPILDRVQPHLVVIGESSGLKLNIGQRGRAEVFLRTFGRRAHSANPAMGVNAVRKMQVALRAVERYRPAEDPLLGRAILEITDILSSPYPGASVVPERCEATFDRRLVGGETPETVVAELTDLLASVVEADFNWEVGIRLNDAATWTGVAIDAPRFAPAWQFSPDEPWIDTVRAILAAVGQTPQLGTYSFCTNGSESAGARDIPTIGYGPGDETQAHTVDEYIAVDSLVEGSRGYLALMQNLGRNWRKDA